LSDRFHIGPGEPEGYDECAASAAELWAKIEAAQKACPGPILMYGGPYKLSVADRADAAEFVRLAAEANHPRLGDPEEYWYIYDAGRFNAALEHPTREEFEAWVRGAR
jgi:hypothetical protein